MRLPAAALLGSLLLAPPAARAQGASFQGLGDLPGGSVSSVAHAVSSDGSAVAGESVSANGGEAFLWTEAGGLQGLGDFPGAPFQSAAKGVSSGGTAVTGTGVLDASTRAFHWTAAGGMVAAPQLPGQPVIRSVGNGVSADGVTVVGDAGVNPEAFSWTLAGGMVGLGFMPGGGNSRATAISADGQVIVGTGSSSSGTQAFRWTAAGGMVGLGRLPGATTSEAHAVSANGAVVVGGSAGNAFRWTEAGGMQLIAPVAVAMGVSGDGSVIVGQAASVAGAFIWTEDEGIRSLRDVLVAQGVDMTGWDVRWATGVSNDGRVVVGWAFNAQGQQEAFRATLGGVHRWIDPTGGSWDVASNWEPATVPGPTDPVRFDLDASYTVTGGTDAVGGATAAGLSADDGTVDFEMGGVALTATGNGADGPPSLSVSFDAIAKIIAGTSTFVNGIVGYGSNTPGDTTTTARLQVFNAGTELTGSGGLLVGGLDGGRGEVFVSGGALRTSIGVVGFGAVGEAVVGNQGDWTIDDILTVGLVQTGRLTIEEGGGVSAANLRVSSSTSAGQAASVVRVEGVSPTGERARLFVADSIFVGGRVSAGAPARLRVADGAIVTTSYLRVGAGNVAGVIVGGEVTQGFDAEITASTIVVGAEGSEGASLAIGSGGAVEANRFFVGSQGSTGFARVTGLATLTVRAAGFAGDCYIAINGSPDGSALAILEGGQVECDEAGIGVQGQGTVFVGNNGGAPAPSRLVVSRVLKLGEGDIGTLQLAAGEVDAVDAASSPPADPFDVVVFPQGTVMGTGFLFGSVDNSGEIAAGVNCVPSCPRVPGREIGETETLGEAGGVLQIGGRLVQGTIATLAIPLAGPDSTQQGRLRVVAAHGMDGSAALGGTLRLDFQNGYAPQAGDTFLLLDAASTAGAFAGTQVTGLEPGWQFEIQLVNGTVVLNSLSDGVPTTPAEPGAPAARRLVLHPPAPNPAGGETTLRFDLPTAGDVRLAVCDALGREVAVLVDGRRPAGTNTATLHAGRLAPGAYIVRLAAGGGRAARVVTVAR